MLSKFNTFLPSFCIRLFTFIRLFLWFWYFSICFLLILFNLFVTLHFTVVNSWLSLTFSDLAWSRLCLFFFYFCLLVLFFRGGRILLGPLILFVLILLSVLIIVDVVVVLVSIIFLFVFLNHLRLKMQFFHNWATLQLLNIRLIRYWWRILIFYIESF